jgi:hypothetical protein
LAKKTPIVRGNTLIYQHQGQEQVLMVDTPDWYAWLESATAFAYAGEAGRFTARKERAGNQRGGWYWKAYRTRRGKLASLYLGKPGMADVFMAAARESSTHLRRGTGLPCRAFAHAVVPPHWRER